MNITITESMIEEAIEYAAGHEFFIRRMGESVEEHMTHIDRRLMVFEKVGD